MTVDSQGKRPPGRTVIFGFGSQGKAQSQNLRDSGVEVMVSLRRDSPRAVQVRESSLDLIEDPAEAAAKADTAVLLIPDSEQPAFYREVLERRLPRNAALVFAHGFAVHYRRIVPRPDLDVILAAPLAHGEAVRREFCELGAVPCVLAVAQDASGRAKDRARGYARAAFGRGQVIESTFAEEVETDLFAEQAVLCGGMPELARAAFDTLCDAGYNESIAYASCMRELRAIVELMCRDAIAGMLGKVSATAAYGAATRGPRIINESVRRKLGVILAEIRSGSFAKELCSEAESGFARLRQELAERAGHRIEEVHRGFCIGAPGPGKKGSR
ncbi:MAG: ketol-acid reductoisomerase [Proteobacteria bacterium]|nr:ketol-acid reductoisomerase [Pseudomonadota bacterium]